MSERIYHTVDKSNWLAGPWQQEPDKIQFRDARTMLGYEVKRLVTCGGCCR